MSIDISNFSSLGHFCRLNDYTLRQYRKKLNDKMNDMIEMTINKALSYHKFLGNLIIRKESRANSIQILLII